MEMFCPDIPSPCDYTWSHVELFSDLLELNLLLLLRISDEWQMQDTMVLHPNNLIFYPKLDGNETKIIGYLMHTLSLFNIDITVIRRKCDSKL